MQLRARHLFALIPLAAGIIIGCKQDNKGTTSTTSGPAPGAENAAPAPEQTTPPANAPPANAEPGNAPPANAAPTHPRTAPAHQGTNPANQANEPNQANAPNAANQGNPAPPVGGTGPHAAEIGRLATVRCQHEQRCGNVGSGKKFATPDACMSELQSQGVSEVYRRECPGSIDVQRLNTCISEINLAACRADSDPINQISSCSTASLCPSMSP